MEAATCEPCGGGKAYEEFLGVIARNQELWRTVTVALVGKMRRGKTNIARHIAEYYADRGWSIAYIRRHPGEDKDRYLERARALLEGRSWKPEGPGAVVVMDDMSFLVHGADMLENAISQIRHYLGLDDVVLVFIFHYLRAVPPFIRDADVRILASITKQAKQMLHREGMFSRYMLQAYLKEMQRYVRDKAYRCEVYECGQRRPFLVADDVSEEIYSIGLSSYPVEVHEVREDPSTHPPDVTIIPKQPNILLEQLSSRSWRLRIQRNRKTTTLALIKIQTPLTVTVTRR